MKLVILFPMVALVVAPTAVANAQPAQSCAQFVQNIKNLAAIIASGASAYWSHRKNYVELKQGRSRLTVPDAPGLAEQEKAQADSLKAGMPNTLASFKALVATAHDGNCLSPAELAAIAEPAIKLAKGINFDQFPPEAPEGASAQTPLRGPTRAPSR
jgi:hypothetical protein